VPSISTISGITLYAEPPEIFPILITEGLKISISLEIIS
jgi:hypothetical protein